ncbi:tyrosine-type recombinase/integrase [Brevibacillus sp. AG]|uniref:site-specific integrase n=1 Tax=Brevibacillus sp. AG TaxID=3020891 RepID=UPI00232BDCA9|nr:tyrosine-type recombinase/integrase [Brevibacillus sp. AG]MDC0763515.1 tyrosine-type recombinase/integrase [Brevibacillus sp. AG]
MPVYKNENAKGDNKWWYQFYTGEIKNGSRERITKRGFRTKKEAEKAMVEAQAALQKGEYIEPSKKMFQDYLNEWIKTKRNLGEQTLELYESYLRTHIIPILGQIPILKLTAHDIEMFLNSLHDKGLSASTVKRIFSVVNASLNSAELKGIVAKNVANRVEKPQASSRRQLVVWEPEFVSDFLEKTRYASRYWIAVYLAVMTGMRQGEILGLRWSDIDFENRNLTIQQTVNRHREIKDGAKTKKSVRSVALSPETIEVLKEHRKLIVQERVELGPEYQNNDLVVCTQFGGPTTQRAIQKVWPSFLKKTGAPKITFHDLRHTHASLLIKQGVHIKVISERLGHSSITITMDKYGHLMPNMQAEAADGLDSLLKTKAGQK